MKRRASLFGLLLCAALAVASAMQDPGDFDAIVKNADDAREAGSIDKAAGLYQQALHLNPGWKQGWWVLGSMLYDANRYADAEQAFLPLTQLDSDKSAGWAMAGLCEFADKQYPIALSHLQKADHLGLPQSLYDVTQYHIELILVRFGQFDAALEKLSRVAAQGGDNPKLVEVMGLAALRRPTMPEDIPPADHDLVTGLGKAMCDAAAGHSKVATEEFGSILARHPTLPELHYLYGMVLLQSDPDKALTAFQQELEISPKHPQTLISLAAEYVKQNEFQKALPFAQNAVASAPSYFAAHAMLGKVLVEGDLDSLRGIKELERAVELAPANPQSRLALASAYAKVGRKTDAAAQRAEFLKLRNQLDAANAGPK